MAGAVWRRRRQVAYVLLLLCVGFSASGAISAAIWHGITADRDRAAHDAAAGIRDHLNIELLHLHEAVVAVQRFISASEIVTPAEFEIFSEPLVAEHSAVKWVAWVPSVERAHLPRFRQTARGDFGIEIYLKGLKSNGTVSGDASRVFPAFLVQPPQLRDVLTGLDMGSAPTLLAGMQAAMKQGGVVVVNGDLSGTARALSDGMVLVAALDSGSLTGAPGGGLTTTRGKLPRQPGFAMLGADFNALVGAAITGHQRMSGGTRVNRIRILDMKAPIGEREIYRSDVPGGSVAAGPSYREAMVEMVTFANRRWAVAVEATETPYIPISDKLHWLVLALGVLLTLAIAAYHVQTLRKRRQTRALVSAVRALERTVLAGERQRALRELACLIVDPRSGLILENNHEAAVLFGVRDDDLVGRYRIEVKPMATD
jgi:CHASE1-domain containing sensor protein